MTASEKEKRCGCCGGSGVVLAADETERPCSRCRADAFGLWADARRPDKAVGELHENDNGEKHNA